MLWQEIKSAFFVSSTLALYFMLYNFKAVLANQVKGKTKFDFCIWFYIQQIPFFLCLVLLCFEDLVFCFFFSWTKFRIHHTIFPLTNLLSRWPICSFKNCWPISLLVSDFFHVLFPLPWPVVLTFIHPLNYSFFKDSFFIHTTKS